MVKWYENLTARQYRGVVLVQLNSRSKGAHTLDEVLWGFDLDNSRGGGGVSSRGNMGD